MTLYFEKSFCFYPNSYRLKTSIQKLNTYIVFVWDCFVWTRFFLTQVEVTCHKQLLARQTDASGNSFIQKISDHQELSRYYFGFDLGPRHGENMAKKAKSMKYNGNQNC